MMVNGILLLLFLGAVHIQIRTSLVNGESDPEVVGVDLSKEESPGTNIYRVHII